MTEFCKKWLTADPDQLAGYFTEDVVYHNIPMAPRAWPRGEEFIAGFTAGFDGIDFQIEIDEMAQFTRTFAPVRWFGRGLAQEN